MSYFYKILNYGYGHIHCPNIKYIDNIAFICNQIGYKNENVDYNVVFEPQLLFNICGLLLIVLLISLIIRGNKRYINIIDHYIIHINIYSIL